MVTLLGFNSDPSRSALLAELVVRGLLAQVEVAVKMTIAVRCSSSSMTILRMATLLAVDSGPSQSALLAELFGARARPGRLAETAIVALSVLLFV